MCESKCVADLMPRADDSSGRLIMSFRELNLVLRPVYHIPLLYLLHYICSNSKNIVQGTNSTVEGTSGADVMTGTNWTSTPSDSDMKVQQ